MGGIYANTNADVDDVAVNAANGSPSQQKQTSRFGFRGQNSQHYSI